MRPVSFSLRSRRRSRSRSPPRCRCAATRPFKRVGLSLPTLTLTLTWAVPMIDRVPPCHSMNPGASLRDRATLPSPLLGLVPSGGLAVARTPRAHRSHLPFGVPDGHAGAGAIARLRARGRCRSTHRRGPKDDGRDHGRRAGVSDSSANRARTVNQIDDDDASLYRFTLICTLSAPAISDLHAPSGDREFR